MNENIEYNRKKNIGRKRKKMEKKDKEKPFFRDKKV